jgi:hypothetical protein
MAGFLFKDKEWVAEIIQEDGFSGGGIRMSEPNYNRGSFYPGFELEDEVEATAVEIGDFKKRYDTMTDAEKARLPTWLRAQLEQI